MKPKWCEFEETKVRGYYLKEPYDKIFIGCDPRDGMTKEAADNIDVFINVSDSECNTFEPSRPGQVMHWYPVNEMGQWNLAYVFWLKKVLDYHHGLGHRIYLHCHAGAYRSPSAALLWLRASGKTPEQALFIVNERGPTIYEIWKNHGNIHPLTWKAFEVMRAHPRWGLGGILHGTGDLWDKECHSGSTRLVRIKHHYFWFYYQPRSWIRDKWRWLKNWKNGVGWYTEGYGTQNYDRLHFWSWPENAERKPDTGRIQSEEDYLTLHAAHECSGYDCKLACKFEGWKTVQYRYASNDQLDEKIRKRRDEIKRLRRSPADRRSSVREETQETDGDF